MGKGMCPPPAPFGPAGEPEPFDWWGPIIGIGITLAILGGPIWFVYDQTIKQRIAVEAATKAARFSVGQVVRSKIGRFRGVVTSVGCYGECHYSVRFPTASMQEQWVLESELEPERGN